MVRVPVDEEGIQVGLSFLNMRVLLLWHRLTNWHADESSETYGFIGLGKNAWIIEDDYDSELRYNGQHLYKVWRPTKSFILGLSVISIS